MSGSDEEAVRLIAAEVPDLAAVYRFGSTSTGQEGPESDVDFAILAGKRLEPTVRIDLQESLASALGRSVDLVDLRAASTVMAMQAIGRGRLLYEGDTAERGRFEDLTYSLYARLNEERRGVLDRVAREGSVYGR